MSILETISRTFSIAHELRADHRTARVMRWNCCDKNEPGTWGSSGCKRRFHLPPSEGDPGFVAAVRKVVSLTVGYLLLPLYLCGAVHLRSSLCLEQLDRFSFRHTRFVRGTHARVLQQTQVHVESERWKPLAKNKTDSDLFYFYFYILLCGWNEVYLLFEHIRHQMMAILCLPLRISEAAMT